MNDFNQDGTIAALPARLGRHVVLLEKDHHLRDMGLLKRETVLKAD